MAMTERPWRPEDIEWEIGQDTVDRRVGRIGPVEIIETAGEYFLTSPVGHYSNVKESSLPAALSHLYDEHRKRKDAPRSP
jgi:hypothetical protein